METRLCLRDGALARTTLAHAELLDSAIGESFERNPVGTLIVRGSTVGDEDAAIDARLTVEPALARGDLRTFIDDLVARGSPVPCVA